MIMRKKISQVGNMYPVCKNQSHNKLSVASRVVLSISQSDAVRVAESGVFYFYYLTYCEFCICLSDQGFSPIIYSVPYSVFISYTTKVFVIIYRAYFVCFMYQLME